MPAGASWAGFGAAGRTGSAAGVFTAGAFAGGSAVPAEAGGVAGSDGEGDGDGEVSTEADAETEAEAAGLTGLPPPLPSGVHPATVSRAAATRAAADRAVRRARITARDPVW
ncbi:hypothetical protein [Streptomyces celluloflavus]|uniref:hypothetical protein n=1 Tax=Streptomyces celluloflavus TaxID=58344 RepID=UPI0036CCCE6B